MRRPLAIAAFLLVTACAIMHGPRTVTLATSEIEQQIQTDLGAAMELFRGVELRRPAVALMPASERLQLTWEAKLLDGPTGKPISVAVELSGKPVLNAARNAIDLTEVRIEDVRLASLPRFLSLTWLTDRKGAALPDLPLMALPANLLQRDHVAYAATGVSVGYIGLKIDIAPK